MSKFTKGLNDRQYESVTHINGPLLVFAGAGTGKTRVVTSRISHIIDSKFANPEQILGITFTNKAAAEMKERVISMVGNKAKKTQISTFHSFGLKILKEEIAVLKQYSKNFIIYDSNDQMALVRNIIKDNDLQDFDVDEKIIKSLISKSKSEGLYPGDIGYKVTDPILVLQGDADPVVNPASSTTIYEEIASKEKKLVLLPRTNHIIVNSEGKEEIFESIHRFISDVVKKTEEI